MNKQFKTEEMKAEDILSKHGLKKISDDNNANAILWNTILAAMKEYGDFRAAEISCKNHTICSYYGNGFTSGTDTTKVFDSAGNVIEIMHMDCFLESAEHFSD